METKEKQKSSKWISSFFPMGVAHGVNGPTIPLFITDVLGGTVAQVGAALSLSSLASVPAHIVWGKLSDMWKRRKFFIVVGFAGAALSLFMMSLAQTVEMFILFIILIGFIEAASVSLGPVLIMESSDRKLWPEKIGTLTRVDDLGHIAGLIIGTVWLGYMSLQFNPQDNLRMLLFVCAFFGLASVILALITIKEPTIKIESKYREAFIRRRRRAVDRGLKIRYFSYLLNFPNRETFRRLREHGVNLGHELLIYLVAVFIFFIGFIIFFAPFPIFLKDVVGASDLEIFLLYIFNAIGSTVTYVKAGKLVERFGAKKLQMCAVGARVIMFPAVGFIGYLLTAEYATRITPMISNRTLALLVIGLLFMLIGLMWAVITICSVSTVSYLAPENVKGEAMGLYNAATGMGSVCGASIGGVLAYTFDYKIAYLCSAMFLVIGLIIVYKIHLNINKET
ncbi:MAG: MFS transporter [Thermoplasmata archaeon]